MRAWNLLVKKASTVQDIMRGHRVHLCFLRDAKTAKRVHVGDTVIVHNFFGPHCKVEKIVAEKRMLRSPGTEANEGQVPCIYMKFK